MFNGFLLLLVRHLLLEAMHLLLVASYIATWTFTGSTVSFGSRIVGTGQSLLHMLVPTKKGDSLRFYPVTHDMFNFYDCGRSYRRLIL